MNSTSTDTVTYSVSRDRRARAAVSNGDLYLALLKKVLTDTLSQPGPSPDVDSPAAYIQSFIEHCIRGRALTMVPESRLDNVQYCIDTSIKDNVPGDVIETGVWRGGTAIFMKAVLRARKAEQRQVWVADSFEGLPAPDPKHRPTEAKAHNSKVMRDIYGHFAVGLEEVRTNFARLGLLDDNVRFLKGWFKNTLPSAPIQQVAVARLDGDYYDSTMDALNGLYDKVSPGGFIIIDDYGQDDWTYCRQAVDDFRTERHIDDVMVKVDSTCYFWRCSS